MKSFAFRSRGLAIFYFLQIVTLVVFVSFWIFSVYRSPIDDDCGAGELLDNVLAWLETGRLYSSIYQLPARVMNYVPLFPTTVKWIKLWVVPQADVLQIGRTLNNLFFLLSLFIMTLWVKEKNYSWYKATFVTALLTTSFPVLYSLGQFHLEIMAVSLGFFGFYLLRRPDSTQRIILAATCFSLACFTKQPQIISSLCATLWLGVYHRKKLSIFIITGIIWGLLGSYLLQLTFGSEVWKHIFTYSSGTYSWNQLKGMLIPCYLPWLAFSIYGYFLVFKSADRSIELFYFVSASLWILSSGRVGAASQYYVEWSYATVLWVGPALVTFFEETVTSLKNKSVFALLILQIVGGDYYALRGLKIHQRDMTLAQEYLPTLCSYMDAHELVPVEMPGFARACGQEPSHHPFALTNLYERGLWDDSLIADPIKNSVFPVVLTLFDPELGASGVHGERWSPAVVDALYKHYQITTTIGPWKVFRRRGTL